MLPLGADEVGTRGVQSKKLEEWKVMATETATTLEIQPLKELFPL
jgi:hypothetical protein